MIGNMNWQNVAYETAIVSLQVFHVLFFFGCLQLPDKVKSTCDFRLLTVNNLADKKEEKKNQFDEKTLGVEEEPEFTSFVA
jgi:hypothetical protein